MISPFSKHSTRDLLDAVANSERIPSFDLIQECRDRFKALEAGLCSILDRSTDEGRWSGQILAGLLLIDAKALKSIQYFDRIYRDPVRESALSPWFDGQITNIGPQLIPVFRRILSDSAAWSGGRLSAVDILSTLARLYPDQRDSIASAFRALVQSFGGSNTLSESELELVTWTISALVDLGDVESVSVVSSLVGKLSIDEETTKEFQEYADLLSDGTPSPDVARPVGVRNLYEAVAKWDEMSVTEVVEHYKQAMLDSGVDESFVTNLMSISLARFVGPGSSDSVSGLVDALKSSLYSAGIPERDLDSAVKELLITVFAHNGIESETLLPDGVARTLRLKLQLGDSAEEKY